MACFPASANVAVQRSNAFCALLAEVQALFWLRACRRVFLLFVFLEQKIPGVLLGEWEMPGQGLAVREVTFANEVVVDERFGHKSMKDKCESSVIL